MAKSSSDDESANKEAYARLVKMGDAVETPDGSLWVVKTVWPEVVEIASAFRDEAGVIHPYAFGQAVSAVPREFLVKVADAREVSW